jgi:hypothetical protein
MPGVLHEFCDDVLADRDAHAGCELRMHAAWTRGLVSKRYGPRGDAGEQLAHCVDDSGPRALYMQ